jgi:hypothetical protein
VIKSVILLLFDLIWAGDLALDRIERYRLLRPCMFRVQKRSRTHESSSDSWDRSADFSADRASLAIAQRISVGWKAQVLRLW